MLFLLCEMVPFCTYYLEKCGVNDGDRGHGGGSGGRHNLVTMERLCVVGDVTSTHACEHDRCCWKTDQNYGVSTSFRKAHVDSYLWKRIWSDTERKWDLQLLLVLAGFLHRKPACNRRSTEIVIWKSSWRSLTSRQERGMQFGHLCGP